MSAPFHVVLVLFEKVLIFEAHLLQNAEKHHGYGQFVGSRISSQVRTAQFAVVFSCPIPNFTKNGICEFLNSTEIVSLKSTSTIFISCLVFFLSRDSEQFGHGKEKETLGEQFPLHVDGKTVALDGEIAAMIFTTVKMLYEKLPT